MADQLSIYLAQQNAVVGDISGNEARIARAYQLGKEQGADLVLTPELSVVGYPPEDLVLKPFFQRQAKAAVERLAALTAGNDTALIVGAPWICEAGDMADQEDAASGGDHAGQLINEGQLMNAALLLRDGRISDIRYKRELPNYGVFDEKRIFAPGGPNKPVNFNGVRLGIMICEDMWLPDTADMLTSSGIDILLVPTCSPYADDKLQGRMSEAKARVAAAGVPLVFCNQVGGQDELVFDGRSFVLDKDGTMIGELSAFAEDFELTFWSQQTGAWACDGMRTEPAFDRMETLYSALVLALRDYVEKNRFPGVVIGLSGGIDSALSAAIAVDALGADRVRTVMMPSGYTSGESLEDAKACATALGVRYDIISIKDGIDALEGTLTPFFEGRAADTTEENLQSRMRGMILMALSNKFGHMVLTTGNKSEVSVGYATLYGDMCGGYNAIKDVYKMDVFALCRWRNSHIPKIAASDEAPSGEVIPGRIITKPPSAELREDQKDEDSLPPYDRLDAILQGLVEHEQSVSDLVADGFDAEEVARIEHLLYIAEYKRRQAAPGAKLTVRNFGRDRRYPITNGFRSARR